MKLYKTDLMTMAKRLEELERTGLDIQSFRHNDMIVYVAHESNQKDGTSYWITGIESINDPNQGSYPI